ncbi:uncharacterized protein LOC143248799 [Tachypleus tridentatus]|uniref:uncharacterized protein LOC143248799 n=1 Tax=Tachypleus tridentatus TaxID=6853 RepID=UPI003FD3D4B1
MASAELEDLFKTYDTGGTGYLGQEELHDLCAKFGTSDQEADAIFQDLDQDGDGKINHEDFSKGFTNFLTLSSIPLAKDIVIQSRTQSDGPDPNSSGDEDKKEIAFQTWQNLMKEIGKVGNLISEAKHLAMSTELHTSVNPNLVTHFDTLIGDLLESIKKLQKENAKIENIWKSGKKEHKRHLHSLEEEHNTQVKHLELRENKQVDSWLKFVKDPIKDDQLSKVFTKLADVLYENRRVRISLMDTQTSVALMRNDIVQLRRIYEEKCRELRSVDTKRLQVTNDTLGDFIDVERTPCRKQTPHVELGKTGSVIEDYICAEMPSMRLVKSKQSSMDREESNGEYFLVEDIEDPQPLSMTRFGLNNDDNCNMDCSMDDIDSGLSTLRDATETDDFSDYVIEENEKQKNNLMPDVKRESSTSTQSQYGRRKSGLPERRPVSKSKFRREILSMFQYDTKVKSGILEREHPLSYSSTDIQSEEGSPFRRVTEIKRQLGLDLQVAGYTRQLSSKHSTPISTVDGAPVPAPRLSLKKNRGQARKLSSHPQPRVCFKQQNTVVTKKSDVNKIILNESIEEANIHEERIAHTQENSHQQQKWRAVEGYSLEPRSSLDRTQKVNRSDNLEYKDHPDRMCKVDKNNSLELHGPPGKTYKIYKHDSLESKDPPDSTYEVDKDDSLELKGPLNRTYEVDKDDSLEFKGSLNRTYEVDKDDSLEFKGPLNRTYEVDKDDSLEFKGSLNRTYEVDKDDSLEFKGSLNRTYEIDKDNSLELKGPPDRSYEVDKDDNLKLKGPPDRTYEVEKDDSLELKDPPDRRYKAYKHDSLEPIGPPDITHKPYKYDRFEPIGPPDRTYKVVFVGDVAVGKSSLIIRLSKGIFVENLTSTLGVDFFMKHLRVDGRNIAVELWDTAGQERFRSITQSYFRKADGIVLVYDCTNERSFLNVRQWIDAVDVSCFYTMMALHGNNPTRNVTSQRIPVVILANKTDKRKTAQEEKRCCVSTKDGQNLAKDFEALFIEVSAKTGQNVLESLVVLARAMSATEDTQVRCSGLSLKEAVSKPSASNRCLRKCSK